MRELTDEEREVLSSYLWNDSGGGDLTSCLFDGDRGMAVIVAEDDCVLSGIAPAIHLFEDTGCNVELLPGAADGSICGKGSEVLKITGPVAGMLRAERIALNILSRMSGIATIAREASDIVENVSPGTRVAGTRKTTPGFNLMEKRALIDGGALPHRKDLASLAMIKDNHIDALGGGPDAIFAGVEMIRDRYGPYIPIEVEVEDRSHALAALEAGADIIMLDNMSPEKVTKVAGGVLEEAERDGKNVTLEASGGITMDNIAEYAPHVDVISMGSLTYGALSKGFRMDHRGNLETVDADDPTVA